MPTPRMKEKYKTEVMPELTKRFGYSNVMQVPKLEKIVINMGLGEAIQNAKILDVASSDMASIAGQVPAVTRARISVASFKLRQGMSVGCRVTLRGDRMYEFYDRLVHVALPRVRDFRGVPTKSFDGRGNYSMGIKEHTIFPEIDYDKITKILGMNISIVTTAGTDEEGRELLNLMDMPFQRN